MSTQTVGTSPGGIFLRQTGEELTRLVFLRTDGQVDTLTSLDNNSGRLETFDGVVYELGPNVGVVTYDDSGTRTSITTDFTSCRNCFKDDRDQGVFGRYVYFRDGTGFGITDGTAGNYQQFWDGLDQAITANGKLFGFADDALSSFDPETGAEVSLSTNLPNVPGGRLYDLQNVSATESGVIFIANQLERGYEVYTSDGTPEGTLPLGEIHPGSADGVHAGAGSRIRPESAGQFLAFADAEDTLPRRIYVTDGTRLVTVHAIEDESDATIGTLGAWSVGTDKLYLSYEGREGANYLYYVDMAPAIPTVTSLGTVELGLFVNPGQPVLGGKILYTNRDARPTFELRGPTAADSLRFFAPGNGRVEDYTIIGDRVCFEQEALNPSRNPLIAFQPLTGELDTLTEVIRFLNFGAFRYQFFSLDDGNYLYAHDAYLGESIFEMMADGSTRRVVDLYDRTVGLSQIEMVSTGDRILASSTSNGGVSRSGFVLTDGTIAGTQYIGAPHYQNQMRYHGNIGNRYYTSGVFLNRGITEIDATTNSARVIVPPPGTDTDRISTVTVGDKIYFGEVREYRGSNYEHSVVGLDPVTLEREVIFIDSFFGSFGQPYNSMSSYDGHLYFTTLRNGANMGIYVYSPTGGLRQLGEGISTGTSDPYFQLDGDRLLLSFGGSSPHTTVIVTPDGLQDFGSVDLSTYTAVGLGSRTLFIHSHDLMIVQDDVTLQVTNLADSIGTDPAIDLFRRTEDGRVIFIGRDGGLWITDGTVAGTNEIYPDISSLTQSQIEAFEVFETTVVLVSAAHQAFLIDYAAGRTTTVDLPTRIDNDSTGPDKYYARLGSRLYFLGFDDQYGQEIHYLELGGGASVRGRVYEDRNRNASWDPEEPTLEGIALTNGRGQRTFTDSDGEYTFAATTGNTYSIAPEALECYSLSTLPSAYTLAITADSSYRQIDFGHERLAGQTDLAVSLTSATQRCGFATPFWVTVSNRGCTPIAGELRVVLPPEATLLDSTGAPADSSTPFFSVDTLQPFRASQFRFTVRMPNEDFAGQDLPTLAVFTYEDEQGETQRDSTAFDRTLRCAIDPNDKLVSPARAAEAGSNYTRVDEELTYTIRFQNTGNDTAFTVRLEDQLDPLLDYSTFRPLAASHKYRADLTDGGFLTVNYENILLPDSSTDYVGSNGFFSFTIETTAAALNNKVTNTASIYFDFNRPVITNSAENEVVEFLDEDQDGFPFWEDCNDRVSTINPAATEISGNEVDENCDGQDGSVSMDDPLPGAFSVYPNPTTGHLFIEYDLPGVLNLTVYDGRGRQVLNRVFSARDRLDLSHLAEGVYLIRVVDGARGKALVRRVTLH